MFKEFVQNYYLLSDKIKNILLITFLYSISNIFINSFIGVILFKQRENVHDLIVFNVYNISFGLGSILLAIALIPYLKLTLSAIFKLGLSLILLSFIYLLYYLTIESFQNFNFNIFIAINSIGNSIYWHGVNVFELKNTDQKDRLLYLSFTQFGKQILAIMAPLLISAAIIINDLFSDNEYLLLIIIITISVLFALRKSNHLDEFKPKKIKKIRLKKESITSYFYFFINGMNYVGFIFLGVYMSSLVFKNVYEIGIFQFIVNLISMFLIVNLASRVEKNNIKLLLFYSLVIIASLLPLMYETSLISYTIFTLMFSIAYPMFSIFTKERLLKATNDISSNKTNSLFIKEFFLNNGRLFLLFIMLGMYQFLSTEKFLSCFLYLIMITFIIEFVIIFTQKLKKP